MHNSGLITMNRQCNIHDITRTILRFSRDSGIEKNEMKYSLDGLSSEAYRLNKRLELNVVMNSKAML